MSVLVTSSAAARAQRIAFATSAHLAALTPDDRLAAAALEEAGITVEAAVWSDADVAWEGYDLVVVRSCWDYFHQLDAFRAWIDRLEALGVPLHNPPALLRWNLDKRYLRQLGTAGVRVPETHWVERSPAPDLAALLAASGWDEAVVKPVVSAGGFDTWRVRAADAAAAQAAFAAFVERHGAVMVQRFLPAILDAGEWSLVFVRGRFSHALLKRAAAGEFRVQTGHGGTASEAAAPDWLVAAGTRVLDAVVAAVPLSEPPLYARVDGVVAEASDGQPALVLMELEALEPELFFRTDAGAPARFAMATAALGAAATRA